MRCIGLSPLYSKLLNDVKQLLDYVFGPIDSCEEVYFNEETHLELIVTHYKYSLLMIVIINYSIPFVFNN